MNLPVYVLTTETIPIPTTTYLLDLPRGQDFTKDCWIIFSPSRDAKIGALATLLEIEKTTEYILYTYKIVSRVHIDTQTAIEEVFSPLELELSQAVDNYITKQSKKNNLITSLKEELDSVKSTFDKMNIIADQALRSSELRKLYLESNDNNFRWTLILKELYIKQEVFRPAKSKHKKFMSPEEEIESLLPKLSLLAQRSISKELKRLKTVNQGSNEYSMILDYLSWVRDIPWGTYADDVLDLKQLETQLNTTHYGLSSVKDHIVEHFCIEKISGATTGGVMCFVGNAGTGKTSLAYQIAKAAGRPLVKIALGGVSDEAEIRGHRRTYLAARPSRIIMGLHQAKVQNPIVVFDEIDKIGTTNGNPAGALLEILDPEQNYSFVDRYLEFPVDLSKVLFICTANNLASLHDALKDRMDVIEFPDYDQSERQSIIQNYMLPKIIADYNLADYKIEITSDSISTLSKTTQLREIERQLKKLFRKAAVLIYTDRQSSVLIDNSFLSDTFNNINIKPTIGFS